MLQCYHVFAGSTMLIFTSQMVRKRISFLFSITEQYFWTVLKWSQLKSFDALINNSATLETEAFKKKVKVMKGARLSPSWSIKQKSKAEQIRDRTNQTRWEKISFALCSADISVFGKLIGSAVNTVHCIYYFQIPQKDLQTTRHKGIGWPMDLGTGATIEGPF